LKDNGSPANANYDFEFALFDALSGGNQIGATIPKHTVLVSNGVFAVKLDFGSQFPGANRYLEVRVKLSGQPNPGRNVYIAQPDSLVITSPNGACWFSTVNNAGALSTISVTCP
ncbi:MAG: hypothetical protein ABJB40_07735, partial [Acidobacteriota bacterium]